MAVRTPVRFVMLRPRQPANVAAACRALKNMGFARLILVEPPLGLDEARALAYGAWDVLDASETAPSLRAAVSDCAVVVATSGRTNANTLTPRRLAETLDASAAGGAAAVVFGPEDHGLTTAERRLCHLTVRIPSAPEQPSLNLAQAVLVLAYELYVFSQAQPPAEQGERVTAGEFESAIDDLRTAFVDVGFLNRANPDAIMGELRRLLWRGNPTAREVALLRGLARQVDWAAQRVGVARDGGVA
jgi:TrmH family RNA methyltransferase